MREPFLVPCRKSLWHMDRGSINKLSKEVLLQDFGVSQTTSSAVSSTDGQLLHFGEQLPKIDQLASLKQKTQLWGRESSESLSQMSKATTHMLVRDKKDRSTKKSLETIDSLE